MLNVVDEFARKCLAVLTARFIEWRSVPQSDYLYSSTKKLRSEFNTPNLQEEEIRKWVLLDYTSHIEL